MTLRLRHGLRYGVKTFISRNSLGHTKSGTKRLAMVAGVVLLSTGLTWAQWVNGQPAEFEIGQTSLNVLGSASVTATGLNFPQAVALDLAHGKLYVSDNSNHRVLRYAYPISANQPPAEIVFGQLDFVSGTANRGGSVSANTLSVPNGLAVFNGDLWVGDRGNDRILKFARADTITRNAPNANVVLGQPDFVTIRTFKGLTDSSWVFPEGMSIDPSGNLWVADLANFRVVRYNNVSGLTNYAMPNAVLGQSDFVTTKQSKTQNGFVFPRDVCATGTTLWVADGKRVMRFDNPLAKGNGAAADGVLGNRDFVGAGDTSVATQSAFNVVYGVAVDGNGRLYAGDGGNFRVMIFNNATSKANGANADNVLGQMNFTTHAIFDPTYSMNGNTGMAVDGPNRKLLVVDKWTHRVLQFGANAPLHVPRDIAQTNTLEQNYPNPFNPTTNFSYRIAEGGMVRLEVFTLLGTKVATLVNEQKQAGEYAVRFDGSGLASGVYFYRLQTGAFVGIKKFVLLR